MSLCNRNPESVSDGQQRTFEDFQFDVENALTMSPIDGEVN